VPVFQVRPNVFWETDTAKAAFEAPSTQDGCSVEAPGNREEGSKDAVAAESKRNDSEDAGEEAVAVHIFQPTEAQESSALDIITKWQYIAAERAKRRPNFDIYQSTNDELISTSSQLTYSVTEAVSTGGQNPLTVGAGIPPSGPARPDSPSNSSMGSSTFPSAYQGYRALSYSPFTEKIRGNFVVKLGKRCWNYKRHLVVLVGL
jgi:hypothetical protein